MAAARRVQAGGGGRRSGWLAAAAAAGCLAYWVLFYAARCPSWGVDVETGRPFRRGVHQLAVLVRPDDLVRTWLGQGRWPVSVGDRAPVAGLAAAWLAAAAAVGFAALAGCGAEEGCTRLERWTFRLAVGLNVNSLFTLLAGLAGWLSRGLFFGWVALALLAAAVRWEALRRSRRRLAGSAGGGKRRRVAEGKRGEVLGDAAVGGVARRWGRRLAWLAAPPLAAVLLGAMLPPWDFDVREYHLQAPKEWRLAGRIDFVPHNVYANMPLGAEMHALAAMTLAPPEPLAWWRGAMAGKLLIGVFAVLGTIAVWAAGRRLFGPLAGGAAAAMYASTPWVARVSMAGLVEAVWGFYLFAALYAAWLWRDWLGSGRGKPADGRAARSKLVLAGFLAGSAAACKYPAWIQLVAPLAIWAAAAARRAGRPAGRAAAIAVLAALFAGGPWLAKNAVLAGNPVYPLAARWLDGRTRTSERMEQWRRAHQTPRDERGRAYSWAGLQRSVAQLGWRSQWLSPVLVPLALAALVGSARRRAVWGWWAVLAWLFAFWWLATHRIDRFWVPAMPVLALLAGAGVAWPHPRWWRAGAAAAAAAGSLAATLLIASPRVGDNRYFVSLEALRRDEPPVADRLFRVPPAHRWLNARAGQVGVVLLVGDAQPFDLVPPALYNTCFDACWFERLMKGRSRRERLAALRRLGVTHVVVDWSEIRRYRATYGFTDYVTPQRVRGELVERQGLLRPVPLPADPETVELFVVSER